MSTRLLLNMNVVEHRLDPMKYQALLTIYMDIDKCLWLHRNCIYKIK